jgi:hypothetical protein
MIRIFSKIPEIQNMKKKFQNSHEEGHLLCFLACEKLHTKFLKTPKMTKRKLKTSNFQNTKTKDLRKFPEKIKYPISFLVKLHMKKLKTPEMTRRKLKTFFCNHHCFCCY